MRGQGLGEMEAISGEESRVPGTRRRGPPRTPGFRCVPEETADRTSAGLKVISRDPDD